MVCQLMRHKVDSEGKHVQGNFGHCGSDCSDADKEVSFIIPICHHKEIFTNDIMDPLFPRKGGRRRMVKTSIARFLSFKLN